MKRKDLKEWLDGMNWTQGRLAEALGMSERTVRRYISGDAKIPRAIWLATVALQLMHAPLL